MAQTEIKREESATLTCAISRTQLVIPFLSFHFNLLLMDSAPFKITQEIINGYGDPSTTQPLLILKMDLECKRNNIQSSINDQLKHKYYRNAEWDGIRTFGIDPEDAWYTERLSQDQDLAHTK